VRGQIDSGGILREPEYAAWASECVDKHGDEDTGVVAGRALFFPPLLRKDGAPGRLLNKACGSVDRGRRGTMGR
jgi:hypothetical protein